MDHSGMISTHLPVNLGDALTKPSSRVLLGYGFTSDSILKAQKKPIQCVWQGPERSFLTNCKKHCLRGLVMIGLTRGHGWCIHFYRGMRQPLLQQILQKREWIQLNKSGDLTFCPCTSVETPITLPCKRKARISLSLHEGSVCVLSVDEQILPSSLNGSKSATTPLAEDSTCL